MPYIIKRLLMAIPLLIGITALAFCLMQLAPGDPSAILMDPSVTSEDMARIRENLGLNQPIWRQYIHWLTQLCQGNFGTSFVTGKPVLTAIAERLPATLYLSISSLSIILLITFPLGLISGFKKGTPFDQWVAIFTFLGLSIPIFWLGLILILVFSVTLNWFPTSGFMDDSLIQQPLWHVIGSILWHMILPLISIVVGGLAGLTRYHRSGVIMILDQDYITAARARGLSITRILCKHVFKNAALPIITILGLLLPGLIGGSFVVEYIFAWPGMGQLGIAAVFSRDYPILMGTLVFSSLLIILGTLLSDLLYRAIDPRIAKT